MRRAGRRPFSGSMPWTPLSRRARRGAPCRARGKAREWRKFVAVVSPVRASRERRGPAAAKLWRAREVVALFARPSEQLSVSVATLAVGRLSAGALSAQLRGSAIMPVGPSDLRSLDPVAPWPRLAWSTDLLTRNGFAGARELRGVEVVDLPGLQDAPRADYREQVGRLIEIANSRGLRGAQL